MQHASTHTLSLPLSSTLSGALLSRRLDFRKMSGRQDDDDGEHHDSQTSASRLVRVRAKSRPILCSLPLLFAPKHNNLHSAAGERERESDQKSAAVAPLDQKGFVLLLLSCALFALGQHARARQPAAAMTDDSRWGKWIERQSGERNRKGKLLGPRRRNLIFVAQ